MYITVKFAGIFNTLRTKAHLICSETVLRTTPKGEIIEEYQNSNVPGISSIGEVTGK